MRGRAVFARRGAGAAVVLLAAAAAGCAGPAPLDTGDALTGNGSGPPPALWSRDLGRGFEVPPSLVDGDWIVGMPEGTLFRLDGRTGERRWRRKLAGPVTEPAFAMDTLLVVGVDAPGDRIAALRPGDGDKVWRKSFAVPLVVGEDSVLVGVSRGGRVERLRPGTGGAMWRKRYPGAGWRRPLLRLGEGLVLVPVRRDSVYALRLEDGSRAWGANLGAWPDLAGAPAAVAATTDDSLLVIVDPATGRETARRRLDALAAGPPLRSGDAWIVSLRNGEVAAFAGAGLDPVWTRRVESPLVVPAVLFGASVVQPGARGRIDFLDPATGAVTGSWGFPQRLIVPAVVGNGLLAVGGARGTLWVFAAPEGGPDAP